MDEDTLVTGYQEGTIKIWDVGLGFALREKLIGFEDTKASIKNLKITHENSLYAIGSDGKLNI